MKKTKRRLPSPAMVLTMALMMAAGFGVGWLTAWQLDRAGLPGWQMVLLLLIAVYLGLLVHIVLHEGGHLAAGLATGYSFVSFRIGSIMLQKKEGRLRVCRYQLAGTGGQPGDIARAVFGYARSLRAAGGSGYCFAVLDGSGTVLDSARFRYMLSVKMGADIRNIHGFMAGEHGESQFAVWSSVHVSAMAMDSYCAKRGIVIDKDELVQDIVSSGAQVIKRKGVTNFAIAAIVAELCATIMGDRGSIFNVTSMLDNYYGISDVCISVPCILGKSGVKEHIAYDFTDDEMVRLQASARSIRNFMDDLKL